MDKGKGKLFALAFVLLVAAAVVLLLPALRAGIARQKDPGAASTTGGSSAGADKSQSAAAGAAGADASSPAPTAAIPMGSAPAPSLTRLELRGKLLDNSGSSSSDYLYTKDDFDQMAGRDRRVRLHRYSLDGRLQWTAEVGYFVDVLELKNGNILVGGTMRAWLLDPQGQLLHEEVLEEGNDIFAEMAETPDGTIVAMRNRTTVYAFSPQGRMQGMMGPGAYQGVSGPLVTPDNLIIVWEHNKISVINTRGGLEWNNVFKQTGEVSVMGKLLILEPDDTSIMAVDLSRGRERWRARYPGHDPKAGHYLSYLTDDDGPVYFWESQGGLQALDSAGQLLWDFDESTTDEHGTRWGIWDCALDPQGNIYVTLNNQLVSIDPQGNERWRTTGAGDMLDTLRVGEGFVLVESRTDPPQDVVDAALAKWEAETAGMSEEEKQQRYPLLPEATEHMYCIDSATGKLLWDMLDNPSLLPPQLRDDCMIWAEPKEGAGGTQVVHLWKK